LLNENKVKMMTKMAIYEKNEGRKMIKTAKYFKSDYIAFGVLRTLITTTIAFIIMLVMGVLYNIDKIITDINNLDYSAIVTGIIICYIVMLILFSVIALIVYGRQYDNSRKGLKRYFSRLNKLERFYNGHKRKN
jgi:uncharacterized BrkB/YihY/UPF0761 family membrane protein